MYKALFKPLMDIIFSFIVLLVLSPMFIGIIILLTIANKGRPFYCQKRPGKNGKLFRLIKFRTMIDKFDINGIILPDKYRITRVGRFLRSTSIDEFPQLLNILSLKMSFIGPRPLLKEYLQLYNPDQARRHEVKPGITGWAQVNGRNSISWNEKFELDVWYVDNISVKTDLKIFFKTVLKVLSRQGIDSSEQLTMKAFTGNN